MKYGLGWNTLSQATIFQQNNMHLVKFYLFSWMIILYTVWHNSLQ